MSGDPIELGRGEANLGVTALRQGRRDQAGEHFLNALDHFEAIEDSQSRRHELSTLATLLEVTDMPDLALMAAGAAIELDRTLDAPRQLAGDLLTLGNAHMKLDDSEKARPAFQEALDICLENDFLDDAASASTNLATLVANLGDLEEATRLLKDSLSYLEQQAYADTEINTRIALVQVLAATEQDDEQAISTARPLFDAFAGRLRRDQSEVVTTALSGIVDRYLRAHPELDPEQWKAENFSGVLA